MDTPRRRVLVKLIGSTPRSLWARLLSTCPLSAAPSSTIGPD